MAHHRHGLLLVFILHHTVSGTSQCGVSVNTKIVGGQDVPSLQYPWFVALVDPALSNPLQVYCGGSLITSTHVLTAAHCFPSDSGVSPEQLYRAVFELVDRCEQIDAPNLAITRVDINPIFNPETLQGDVAIATLEKAVSYTPICLPAKNSVITGGASIIGFGSTLTKSMEYPCIMQEAKVIIFSKRRCIRSGLLPEFSRIPGTICAGLLRGGVDSCDGDSGGPLQTVSSNGVYTIQGIVSFGEGCGRRNLPGVYTQVSAYRDYIDSIIHSSSDSGGTTSVGSSGNFGSQSSLRPTNLLQAFFQGLFNHPHPGRRSSPIP